MPSWRKVLVSGSDASLNSLFVINAVTASIFSGSHTGSLLGTASYVTGSIFTGTNAAASSSFSFTASYVNPLRQDVIISGSLYISSSGPSSSLLIGGNTTSSAENVLVVGLPAGGAGSGEGGQILLQAPNTSLYTSASMIDNYQNSMRFLRGSNTGSDAVVASFNMHSKQVQFPSYNGASAFVGTAVANLAVDSNGNIITVSTSGGTVFPYTGNAVITGSLLVSGASGAGSITASSAIVSLANNQMYFRGGDDAELWDVNERNTVAIVGQQDSGIGVIKLGSGSSGAYLIGRTGSLFTSGALYVSGGLGITGSVTVTIGGFTGSLFGTASYVTGSIFTGSNAALSASYAITSSNASTASRVNSDLTQGTGITSFTYNGSTAQTVAVSGASNLLTNEIVKWTGFAFDGSNILDNGTSIFMTASTVIVSGASTAFVVTGSVRSSGGFTGSLFGTASYVTGSVFTGSNAALSASYAFTASYANYVTGSGTTNRHAKFTAGNTIGDSLILDDGTNIQITGSSIIVSGASTAFTVTGSVRSSGGFTGSLFGTASYVTGSIFTGSNAALSASYAVTANTASSVSGFTGLSGGTPYYLPLIQNLNTTAQPLYYAAGGIFSYTESTRTITATASFATTASYVTGSIFTGSNSALSASYALTASYALSSAGGTGASDFPYTGSAIISGSLIVTGSTFLSGSSTVELTIVGDTHITGSLILSGSTTVELMVMGDQQVTGSLNVTGSLFATNIKAGTIANTSFTSSPVGSPSSSAVTFSPPFSSNNYAVTITGNDARVWDIDSKTATGFTVSSNSTQALTGDTYWIAIGY